ncbi:MAG TPA: hypothetical protein VD928_00980 [Candidatus Paceibacterota bacterium]|nr:hypothetical protein [Candidatus Paceibacterota bacterium]
MKKWMLVPVLAVLLTSSFAPLTHAQTAPTGQRVTLAQLGWLQLVAHDLFNVNRTTGIDAENGKLDLSTIFDHGEANIVKGGERRNSENIALFTVTMQVVGDYQKLVSLGIDKKLARKIVVAQFHITLRNVYKSVFGTTMPIAKMGQVTPTENLAFRTIHDFLPGKIYVNGVLTPTLDASLKGKTLSAVDLEQLSSPLDGKYDDEFRNIVFPGGSLDLLERDSSFAQQFNTDYTLEFFLAETADGRFNYGEKSFGYIREMFAKGMWPTF